MNKIMQKTFIFICSLFHTFIFSHGMYNSMVMNKNILSPSRRKTEFQKIGNESSKQLKIPISTNCGNSARLISKNQQHLFGKCEISSQKIIKIRARIFPNPSQLPKKFIFNYEIQLKLMLSHQHETEGMQQKLFSHCSNCHNDKKTLSYNIFALKDALDNEIKLAKTIFGAASDEKTNAQRVLSIVHSLWESIKYLEQSSNIPVVYVNGMLRKLQEEQMRFIGLILWHFVFRQNPIWDSVNENLVFFAKLSPNIEPSDVLTIEEMLKDLEKQLEERVDGQNDHFDKLLDEKQFFEEYLHDQQLHNQLKQQRHGAAQSIMEEEKRSELAQKLQLLRSQYICLVQRTVDQAQQQCAVISSQIQYYNLIDRAFIVFRKDATALILLARALLEDKMDGKQLENYLNNDQNLFNNINIDDDDYSYIKMASKLGKISKDY